VSRPTTLPGPWAQLAQAAGGVGALARLLGVSRRTIERWGAGVLPGAIVRGHVIAFAKQRGVAIVWGESSPEKAK
jgi:DNA-binding transcriptional regulator YdaS (Cro superfamily)